ncbi:MAG TPA: heat-shock protein Hsp20 [Clostridiales bacterium]|nr:MAG: hypothetical protein A2Y22_02710 [Clostridiales bacterium GWD2_32_59]HAN10719.1 heat-shock protein Hsp20 [Clostridiales bacterium]
MNLTEWNPFRDFDTFSPFRTFEASSIPKVDVYQTQNDIVITAEIPGVSKKDFDIYATETSIKISAERRKTDVYDNKNIYRSERYYGTFYRTIALPTEINTDNVKASYQDGVLSIIASKTNNKSAIQHKVVID